MAKTTPDDGYPDIPDQRRFTIGEASELCRVKPHVLRYWERIYPTLQKVQRRNKQRYYSTEDLTVIRTISKLKAQGLNSASIAKFLTDGKDESGFRAQLVQADKIRAELERAISLLD